MVPIFFHPTKVIITGYSCNNNCIICSYGFKKSGDDHKTTRQLYQELQHAKRNNYRNIELSGGEPTIRKDFFELIRKAKSLNFEGIGINTNGCQLAQKSFLATAYRLGLNNVTITLLGLNASTHDRLTRRKNSFAQTVSGLKNTLNLKKIKLAVNTVLIIDTVGYLSELGKFLIKLGVKHWNILGLTPEGFAKENYKILSFNYKLLNQQLASMDNVIDHFKTFSIFNLPFCVFNKDVLSHPGINIVSLTKKRRFLNQSERADSVPGAFENKTYLQTAKIKLKDCVLCRFFNECEGLWLEQLFDFKVKPFFKVKTLAKKNNEN